MKKILFLTDMWSPQPTANVICVKNIASVLIERGYKVYANAFEGEPKQCKNVIDGVDIVYTKPSLARAMITKAMYASNPIKKLIYNKIGIALNRITRLIFLPFYPIVAPSFSKRWSEKICKQIAGNNIDIVISVNAPLDSIATGYLVKKKCPYVKWVAYYIDGGSNYGKEQSFLTLKMMLQRKSIKWENKVLELADKIIIMEGHADYYRSVLTKSNFFRMKVLNVPLFNISQMSSDSHCFENSDKEIWTYMGTIRRGFYDPQKLFSWFEEYSRSHNAELHLYGATNMDEFIRKNSDGKHIIYHGLIPHDEVEKILNKSNVLVYFRSEKIDSVSGKFFEYIMFQKPIVYFGPKNDINWIQLQKYPLGVAIDQDTGEQTKSLDLIFNKKYTVSKELLWKNYYTSTPDAFADVIDKIEVKQKGA